MELSSSFLVVSPSVIPTKSSSSVFCTYASTGVKRLSASTLKCDVAFRPRAPHVDTRHSIYSISIRRYSPISTMAHSPSDRERFVPSVAEVKSFSVSLWKFLRPHTVRGTVLGSVALIARALYENPDSITWAVLLKAFLGIVALLCGNGYIVGINQIYDVGIDKVNKPYLPVAAGDLSQNSAWLLVFFFAFSGFLLVRLNYGPFITSLYFLGLLLGTLYSVPPFRMKRFPVAAFLIIATVRGFLLNYGVYYATRDVLALDFQWNPSVAFITIFVTLFALVIAITKDLPDVDGDRKFKIPTLASKLGVRNVAFLGTGLLMLNYVGAVSAAVCIPLAFHACLMIAAHALLASGLIFQAWKLERAHYTKEAISKFYQFLWNLFYAEYILFPFI